MRLLLLACVGVSLCSLPDGAAARARAPLPAAPPPESYVCYRAAPAPTIDGRLDDPAWAAVRWSDPFIDIEGDAKPRPRFRTRVKMLWDDRCFYLAAEMEEPHVWGTLTQRDSVIFHDNDFEVFIDPDGDNHAYYELEVNALNTVWDLFLPLPYRDGGRARNDWDIDGLRTAVHVDGTLNDPRDRDRGWSVEIAIPWTAFNQPGGRPPIPPRHGDRWRVNFSRVQWPHEVVEGRYRKPAGAKEDNWVWSPQGVVDMHRPERWGYVQFSTARPGMDRFRPDATLPARDLLHQVYYAQRAYRKQHGRYAATLRELGLADLTHPSLVEPVRLLPAPGGYEVSAVVRGEGETRRTIRLRNDSLIRVEPPGRTGGGGPEGTSR